MATHQVTKRKKYYFGDQEEEGKTNPCIYMFCESEKLKHNLYVSEFHLDVLSAHLTVRKPQDFVCGKGYAVYGSKIYAIGGEDTKGGGLPLDVSVYDLSKSQWEEGPSLMAGKPNPVVVVLKGKIYALAGHCRYSDPSHSPTTNLFEVLDVTPGTREGGLRWIGLPDPPFSDLYPSIGDQIVSFHTVVDNAIYFVLNDYRRASRVSLYSFNVAKWKWKDRTQRDLGRDLIAENIKKYHWVSMNSDVVDGVLYMCYADTDSPGVKFIALNLREEQAMPPDIGHTCPAFTRATDVDDKLFWGVDAYRIGVNSLLPCLVIPLKIRPSRDPRFLLLVSHVADKKFVVVCSYYTNHTMACGRRVVYSCLLELVGDKHFHGEWFQYPSGHAVILKQKYQTMSSQLNVLSAWSRTW